MLSKEEIKHIAALARIGVTEEDIERYQKDFLSILGHFDELSELKTDDMAEIGHITGRFNVMGEDKIVNSSKDDLAAILKNAPDERDGQFKVKAVF